MSRPPLARTGLAVCALFIALAGAALAQDATPTPKPTATPDPFSYNGYIRAFYFTRQNATAYPKGTGQIDQAAFNAAVKVHGEYRFGASPWTLGGTFVQADPLGYNTFKMSDTTLPGYSLSTLGEAYIQFKNAYVNAKLGDQSFQSPWANPSDSRVKAVFFRGLDTNANVAPGWTVGISRMTQWESRVSSDFNGSTLLPGSLNADGSIKNGTSGFLLAKASYAPSTAIQANANYYTFYDYATLLWVDGKWYPNPRSPLKLYIAGQYGVERSAGASIAGIIDNRTLGVQIGASFGKNVDVNLGYDTMPWKSKDITAASCAAAQTAAGTFAPTGGSPSCEDMGGGIYRIFYGGLASPYTDSYATDPLFTASISQSMPDRRSAGSSLRIGTTYLSTNRQFKAALSQAWYDYSNGAGADASTQETDVDLTYFFNKVGKGAYRGYQLRHRYAERDIRNTVLYTGLPVFKYNRTQLEFDF